VKRVDPRHCWAEVNLSAELPAPLTPGYSGGLGNGRCRGTSLGWTEPLVVLGMLHSKAKRAPKAATVASESNEMLCQRGVHGLC